MVEGGAWDGGMGSSGRDESQEGGEAEIYKCDEEKLCLNPQLTKIKVSKEKALENYKKYLPSLMAQIKRDDTHLGEDSLAPYYFFSTVPYATSAIEFLFEKEELSDEEKEKLNTVKQELKTGLLSLIQKNGLFEAQGEELYPSSSGYTNPLGGLALIPLAQECSQEKNSALFGILTED